MKMDRFVFFNKWASYLIIGALGPLVAGLGQWADSGTWPPAINWLCIIAGCFIGAASQNLSFFSSAWQSVKGTFASSETPGVVVHQVTETTQTADKPPK